MTALPRSKPPTLDDGPHLVYHRTRTSRGWRLVATLPTRREAWDFACSLPPGDIRLEPAGSFAPPDTNRRPTDGPTVRPASVGSS